MVKMHEQLTTRVNSTRADGRPVTQQNIRILPPEHNPVSAEIMLLLKIKIKAILIIFRVLFIRLNFLKTDKNTSEQRYTQIVKKV